MEELNNKFQAALIRRFESFCDALARGSFPLHSGVRRAATAPELPTVSCNYPTTQSLVEGAVPLSIPSTKMVPRVGLTTTSLHEFKMADQDVEPLSTTLYPASGYIKSPVLELDVDDFVLTECSRPITYHYDTYHADTIWGRQSPTPNEERAAPLTVVITSLLDHPCLVHEDNECLSNTPATCKPFNSVYNTESSHSNRATTSMHRDRPAPRTTVRFPPNLTLTTPVHEYSPRPTLRRETQARPFFIYIKFTGLNSKKRGDMILKYHFHYEDRPTFGDLKTFATFNEATCSIVECIDADIMSQYEH